MKQFLMTLSPVCVGMIVIGGVLVAIGWMKTVAFLRNTPRLCDAGDMERYKDLARFGMWAALALIPLLFIPFLVLVFVPASPIYRLLGLVGPTLVGVVGVKLKEKETMAQATEAHSSELTAERDRVTDSWMKKAFPDF
ncbi:MAG: hypothetical protein H8F28_04960 [Fibrella sp.]|nr:hypothetical protein [Armatimonadota bacterium]